MIPRQVLDQPAHRRREGGHAEHGVDQAEIGEPLRGRRDLQHGIDLPDLMLW